LDTRIVPCSTADVETLRQIAYETYDEAFHATNTAENMETYFKDSTRRNAA